MTTATPTESNDFVRSIVADDLVTGKFGGRVITRFPPEPNGYLHIGHAKSIFLNFGVAGENQGGMCYLRFDDTNPVKEDVEYVESIQEDVRWLGCDWDDRLTYASDYFDDLYGFAVQLIEAGKAYVCDLSADEIREYRGTLTEPGRESPYRDRPLEENLDLFQRMKAGEFPDGSRVLRAKVDMASPNLNMRDPVMYRILHEEHHRTGDKWCIYPTYDFTHGQTDSIEGVTHSICTLEFEDHRPLYDWYLDELGIYHPQQIEFARLNLSHTVLSKRRLLALVEDGHVSGWDDPRMPTLAALRRRGTRRRRSAISANGFGVAKRDITVDLALLEHCVREDLNLRAPRVMAVLNPLKVVIDNYPEGMTEEFDAVNNPEDASMGTPQGALSRGSCTSSGTISGKTRRAAFSGLHRGGKVRLRYACYITCTDVVKDPRTARWWSCTAPTTQSPREAHLPMAAGCRRLCTGFRRPTRWTRKYGCTITCSGPPSRVERKMGGDFINGLNPESLGHADILQGGAQLGRRGTGRPVPVREAGLLLRGCRGLRAGPIGVQPHGVAPRQLGADRAGRSAGVENETYRLRCRGLWIPAFAGMTGWKAGLMRGGGLCNRVYPLRYTCRRWRRLSTM